MALLIFTFAIINSKLAEDFFRGLPEGSPQVAGGSPWRPTSTPGPLGSPARSPDFPRPPSRRFWERGGRGCTSIRLRARQNASSPIEARSACRSAGLPYRGTVREKRTRGRNPGIRPRIHIPFSKRKWTPPVPPWFSPSKTRVVSLFKGGHTSLLSNHHFTAFDVLYNIETILNRAHRARESGDLKEGQETTILSTNWSRFPFD